MRRKRSRSGSRALRGGWIRSTTRNECRRERAPGDRAFRRSTSTVDPEGVDLNGATRSSGGSGRAPRGAKDDPFPFPYATEISRPAGPGDFATGSSLPEGRGGTRCSTLALPGEDAATRSRASRSLRFAAASSGPSS